MPLDPLYEAGFTEGEGVANPLMASHVSGTPPPPPLLRLTVLLDALLAYPKPAKHWSLPTLGLEVWRAL